MLEELKSKTFANEAEEAAWWESREDELANEFKKATAEGRVGIGTVAKRAALPSTTIRLDPDDIAKARRTGGRTRPALSDLSENDHSRSAAQGRIYT